MIQCSGLDDLTTCTSYQDSDGNEATCIESSCGYKLFDHIDISIAGSSDPRVDEDANPNDSFVTVLAVAYSLVPYAVAFVYLVLFLSTGSLVPLNRFVVFGAIAVLNEAVFKRIVKERRPEGSCLYFQSYGMPRSVFCLYFDLFVSQTSPSILPWLLVQSGHAETSIGLLTYILLEMFVMHPNILCGLTCQKNYDTIDYTFELGYGWIRKNSDESVEEPLQTNDVETGRNTNEDSPVNQQNTDSTKTNTSPSKWFCHICALIYTIIFLPVPFSRVYLHDHYRDQVLIGGCVGILVSSLCYVGLMRGLRLHSKMSSFANGEWGRWFGVKSDWNLGFL